MSRLLRHRLRNNTNRTLYLREIDIGGCCMGVTQLEPHETRDNFPAAIYLNRGYRTVYMIVIVVDKYMVFGALAPFCFVAYFELIFDIDEGSHTLIVSGIEAQSTDYFPCRCLPLWNCFKDSGRLKEYVLISGFKAVKAKKKRRLRSGQEMMTIYVMINYDGERKKNDEGGFIWSSGAHTKWRAISIDKNNITLDGVADQICATLGLNASQTKLSFCYLPENCATDPSYIQDSQTLKEHLTCFPRIYKTLPKLHVKMVSST
ncbi:uncharacterized protein [Primulina huaijiensis]|uniref:uncharacterized protein n=1 Tax=Primulina huaijiensis TaxID=1492673 RepID=UPI003CC7694E